MGRYCQASSIRFQGYLNEDYIERFVPYQDCMSHLGVWPNRSSATMRLHHPTQVRLTMDNIGQLMFNATLPKRTGLGGGGAGGAGTAAPGTGTSSPVPGSRVPSNVTTPTPDASVMAQYVALAKHAAGISIFCSHVRISTGAGAWMLCLLGPHIDPHYCLSLCRSALRSWHRLSQHGPA